MAAVDLVDETYVVAPAALLARRFADPALLAEWFPDLELQVFMDRGDRGVRWSVTGALEGSAEVWLEPFRDGTIVHFFLRTRPPGEAGDRPADQRRAARIRDRRARDFKRRVNRLKDEVEAGRHVGEPAEPAPHPAAGIPAAAQGGDADPGGDAPPNG